MDTAKRILTPTELWHLSAQGLHDTSYQVKYTEALAFLIRNKDLSILDTASGGGFPTVNLYNAGFRNIEASDADKESVAKLSESFKALGMSIPVSEGRWHDLSKNIEKKYDVVLNSDNSLVYMDGWPGGTPVASGLEQIAKRLSLVLRSFFELLNDGGFAIIGLGKHYDPTWPFDLRMSKHNRSFDVVNENKPVHIDWLNTADWDNTRILDWAIQASGEEVEGITKKYAYLVTKEELAAIMKDVGFTSVHIVCPDETRDNLIVGIKNPSVFE